MLRLSGGAAGPAGKAPTRGLVAAFGHELFSAASTWMPRDFVRTFPMTKMLVPPLALVWSQLREVRLWETPKTARLKRPAGDATANYTAKRTGTEPVNVVSEPLVVRGQH